MFTARSELLRKHLDRFTHALTRAAKGDVRALHRTRVASRRLRELIPILQLDGETARKNGRRLRRVTNRLGAVRELDVLLLLIDELHVSRREYSEALSRVAVAVAKERDEARERLFDRMPVEKMRRLSRKLARIVDTLRDTEQPGDRTPSAEAWRWVIDARSAARASRLIAAITDAGAVYLPERLHAVRIALKKLRYSVELATEVAGRKPTAELRVLKRAQDALGRLHDLQVLIDRVRQVQASLTPPSVAVWRALDRLETGLENDCRRLHARYMRQRATLGAIAAGLSSRPEPTSQLGAPPPNRRSGRTRDATHTTDHRATRRTVAV